MNNRSHFQGSKKRDSRELDTRYSKKEATLDRFRNGDRNMGNGNDHMISEYGRNVQGAGYRNVKKEMTERKNYNTMGSRNVNDNIGSPPKREDCMASPASSTMYYVNSVTNPYYPKNETSNMLSSESEGNIKWPKSKKAKSGNSVSNRNHVESHGGTSAYEDNKSSICVDSGSIMKDSCWAVTKTYNHDEVSVTRRSVYSANVKKQEEKAKPYRCRYCEVDAVDCVVQCNNCSRWFCNGSSGTCGSHIITHLVRSKHKELKMHQNSVLGDTILECYKCGCRNVFLLGYLPTAEEQVVVIICRDPCLAKYLEVHREKEEKDMMQKKGKKSEKRADSIAEENREKNKKKERNCEEESEWDAKRWQPVIEDRALVDWLVNIPGEDDASQQGKTTTSQYVNQLEELWKHEKDGAVEEITPDVALEDPTKVELHYKDAYHYKTVFAPLIKLEADYDKSVKEGQKQGNVTVRWDIGLNKKRYAHFVYVKEESELRLVVGDELKLSYMYSNGTEWSCQGHISRLYNTEEIALELRTVTNAYGPWNDNITKGYTVEFVWKSTAFDRMQAALKEFADNSYSLSAYLYHKILGHTDVNYSLEVSCNNFRGEMEKKISAVGNFSAPDLADLNHSQIDAVKNALVSPLSLIQGPPGTGKTLTCATLVYHMCQMKIGKVLVTAPSNVAVDQLAVRIHRTGLKVVRLCARSREAVPSIADYLCLHNQLKHLKNEVSEELNKLLELKEEVGELSQKDENRLRKLISYAEKQILLSADVICTTCVGAMDKRLKRFQFRQVLVDEATQATEPECLVPLVRGAKQIVLVGDHCQLGPIIVCKKAANAGLGKSLFERLVMLGTVPVRLEVQYRMHPCLSEFPSFVFYDGSLQNGVTLNEREYPLDDFPWPDVRYPMFFYNSTGLEEMSASGTSYLNRSEAYNMEKLVRTLLSCGLKPSQIGVITPYEGQRAYITSLFQRNAAYQHMSEIEVASVDAFQGREKDFILLSCVRSNKKLGIGFLNDPRRLNVALTRAKYGLIICGNAKVLSKYHQAPKKNWNSNETITNVNSIWILLLSQFQKRNLIVEGSLADLKPLNIDIPEPRKFVSKYVTTNYFLVADDETNEKDTNTNKKKESADKENDSSKCETLFNMPRKRGLQWGSELKPVKDLFH